MFEYNWEGRRREQKQGPQNVSCFPRSQIYVQGDRQSQVLLDNLSLGLLRIDDLYKKLEI